MKESTHVFIGVMIILLLLTVGLRAMILVSPNLTYSEVCKIRYGENWAFEYSKVFGQTCVEIDFISLEYKQRIKVDFKSTELMEQYCKDIAFFDFRKWDTECEKYVKTVKSEGDENVS